MNDQNQFGSRQMFQGNWSCSECNAEITELPFEPDGDKPIFCKECHQAKRQNRGDNQRQMFQGNWKCSGCGADITQLPFEPRDDQSVTCRDCYLKSKNR